MEKRFPLKVVRTQNAYIITVTVILVLNVWIGIGMIHVCFCLQQLAISWLC